MRIVAETNDLLPPFPSENATFTMQLEENHILPIGAAELEYFDDFSKPDEIEFEILKPCHCVKCNRHLKDPDDVGRIIDMSNSLDWSKNPDYSPVKRFSQKQVNHLRLGYHPPNQEIGPDPIRIQFSFKVRDKTGKESPINFFNILIKPVDNKPPVLTPNNPFINVNEGECFSLSTNDLFSLTDPDTKPGLFLSSLV